MCRVNKPRLFAGNGEADLEDRLQSPAKRHKKSTAHVERSMTGVKLFPGDSFKLRALKATQGLNISAFVRNAVAEKISREFGGGAI
ncbi:MAG: hypothetical protein ABL907_08545 [Hyphomicrobium sp.]